MNTQPPSGPETPQDPHDHLHASVDGQSEAITADDLPALAKVVAVSSLRIGAWAAATGLRATRRAVEAARHLDQAAGPAEPANALHEAGQELLRRSRDVWSDEHSHPAYARIIEELAPDEGRILVLLFRKGPQAAVDVRTGGLVGTVSSTLVRANLNMIGALSGCRYVERVPSYLHNLERLGLIWFSRETVTDPMEYQVLEAQPDVLDAMDSVRRARAVRRSIHLTPFGEDFCRDGLGLHLSTTELEGIPRHRAPREE